MTVTTRAGRKPQSLLANAQCQPGDELIGVWPREQLAKMDTRFVERMERAIAARQGEATGRRAPGLKKLGSPDANPGIKKRGRPDAASVFGHNVEARDAGDDLATGGVNEGKILNDYGDRYDSF